MGLSRERAIFRSGFYLRMGPITHTSSRRLSRKHRERKQKPGDEQGYRNRERMRERQCMECEEGAKESKWRNIPTRHVVTELNNISRVGMLLPHIHFPNYVVNSAASPQQVTNCV